jgi:hypothetical protein
MADNNANIFPYPLMFDPSQWSNKFSPFPGQSLNPFMGKMAANAPTDAHGNPISSYADAQRAHDAWQPPAAPPMAPPVTLNSTGWNQNPVGSPLNPTGDWTQLAPTLPGASQQQQANYAYNLGLGGFIDPSTHQASVGGGAGQTSAGAAGASSAPTNPVDMSAAYLQALSNPGKVVTPGATVPQAAPPSNQSGVLQQFLQNWKAKGSPTTGAGNYNNQGFFNALQGQV